MKITGYDYQRYDEVYDEVLKSHVEMMYKKKYREGWNVSQIVRMPSGMWLIKWTRNPLAAPPTTTKEEQNER